jgi:phage terminase Nu1 subunit (DNA packaging protein)
VSENREVTQQLAQQLYPRVIAELPAEHFSQLEDGGDRVEVLDDAAVSDDDYIDPELLREAQELNATQEKTQQLKEQLDQKEAGKLLQEMNPNGLANQQLAQQLRQTDSKKESITSRLFKWVRGTQK